MLGWHISVFRQTNGGGVPAKADSAEGSRLAVWQTGIQGLHWIDALVKEGTAIDLGGDGYPHRYTAPFGCLAKNIIAGPPHARTFWVCGPNDILGDGWEGKTVIDRAVVDACTAGEWLVDCNSQFDSRLRPPSRPSGVAPPRRIAADTRSSSRLARRRMRTNPAIELAVSVH